MTLSMAHDVGALTHIAEGLMLPGCAPAASSEEQVCKDTPVAQQRENSSQTRTTVASIGFRVQGACGLAVVHAP
jgi:hypothetical protein